MAYGHDKDFGDEEDDTDWTQTTGQRKINLNFTPVTSLTTFFSMCDGRLERAIMMEHPPRASLKCDAAHGRRAWIGAIPRDSTVLVTEGHINLTSVFAFEVDFPSATCIADGQRHRIEDMGTASKGGRVLGHLRDDTTVSSMGCTLFLGTRTNSSFWELHTTRNADNWLRAGFFMD